MGILPQDQDAGTSNLSWIQFGQPRCQNRTVHDVFEGGNTVYPKVGDANTPGLEPDGLG
ncbi:MAG: hypothetical protein VKJ64_10955 [Leptolyngbyaceae bacterium]|nr:hypothetical protein [Leptolyngbyaceae bacterium]